MQSSFFDYKQAQTYWQEQLESNKPSLEKQSTRKQSMSVLKIASVLIRLITSHCISCCSLRSDFLSGPTIANCELLLSSSAACYYPPLHEAPRSMHSSSIHSGEMPRSLSASPYTISEAAVIPLSFILHRIRVRLDPSELHLTHIRGHKPAVNLEG